MSLVLSLFLVMLVLVIGEIISIKTKAFIPSVFVSAVIFQERKYLMSQMLPKMLIGGFTTVTIVSVVVASVFINLMGK